MRDLIPRRLRELVDEGMATGGLTLADARSIAYHYLNGMGAFEPARCDALAAKLRRYMNNT